MQSAVEPTNIEGTKQRAGRGHPKIDKAKALQLYAKGYSKTDIAQKLGVTPGAITQSITPLLNNLLSPENLKTYQEKQTDIVDSATAKMLVESLDPSKLKKASTYQLVSSFGILFDKSRLLKGLSTSNVLYAEYDREAAKAQEEIDRIMQSLGQTQGVVLEGEKAECDNSCQS